MIGDKLLSNVFNVIPVVNDLFLGKLLRYSVWFLLEHTSLTEFKEFNEFSWICSNPLSRKDVSFPPTLVPEIVLTIELIEVEDGGAKDWLREARDILLVRYYDPR